MTTSSMLRLAFDEERLLGTGSFAAPQGVNSHLQIHRKCFSDQALLLVVESCYSFSCFNWCLPLLLQVPACQNGFLFRSFMHKVADG